MLRHGQGLCGMTRGFQQAPMSGIRLQREGENVAFPRALRVSSPARTTARKCGAGEPPPRPSDRGRLHGGLDEGERADSGRSTRRGGQRATQPPERPIRLQRTIFCGKRTPGDFSSHETKTHENMQIPSNLASLVDEGLIDEVVRPLMSGKEAVVFLVRSGGELRVAKVYKDAQNRSFKNRAAYTEGRKVRNSRDQRAMDKRSRHGRAQDEAAWRSTEVDMIYRLRGAGVRVPTPYQAIDGVLVMELVVDADGSPAPRLAETSLDRDQATWVYHRLIGEVVRMLCAGVVHGDLSDFNVLMSADGPVIIDFPQSVDAARNQNARKLLLRDVDNLHRFLARFVPEQRRPAYGEEMWELYASSALTPETRLTGRHRVSERRVDTRAVLDLIGDANHDERKRRERQGISMRGAPKTAQSPAPAPEGRTTEGRTTDPRDRPRQAERPAAHAGNGGGPRPQQHGAGQRPQNAGPDRRQQHAGNAPARRPPQHPSGQPPVQYEARQRPQQHGPDHRPAQHATAQRPAQHQAAHRPQHHEAPHRPQHQAAHRPQHHHEAPHRPQHHEASHTPEQHQATQGPPQQGEPQAASRPRRRVVISVSTSDRRSGTRRNP
ncbi:MULTISPECIES: PA4780 family RIO1-like protein kinase [Sorangium]|uniref:PA4780 family RIO1-like protein kinase n=1 Tax=Sorangium TaxID=39643 RepID=UPI003D9C4EFD